MNDSNKSSKRSSCPKEETSELQTMWLQVDQIYRKSNSGDLFEPKGLSEKSKSEKTAGSSNSNCKDSSDDNNGFVLCTQDLQDPSIIHEQYFQVNEKVEKLKL